MRLRRSVALLAVFVSAFALQAPVHAAVKPAVNDFPPFLGDLTGDGIADRITLRGTDAACIATVEVGNRDGSFQAGVVHPLTLTNPDPPNCPDLGTVGSFTARKTPELAVAYFASPGPHGGNDNILVLKNFVQVDSTTGEFLPSTINTQDFNGDGLSDVWESTDEQEGVQSFTSVNGHLTTGPINVYANEANPNLQFISLNSDGDTDMLIGYHVDGNPAAGPDQALNARASVVDGRTGVESILVNHQGKASYYVRAINANGDKYLDVTVIQVGHPRLLFINDGHGHFTQSS